MDAELLRLQKLYTSFSDGELLRLAEDRDNLTETAQTALADELRNRKLALPPIPSDGSVSTSEDEREQGFDSGIPGIIPNAASAVETSLHPGGEIRVGMVALVTFYDGIELSRACDALSDANIDPAIQTIGSTGTEEGPQRFEVWVDTADEARSKQILRERLGLFPVAEADEIDDSDALAEVTEGTIGDFDSIEEAEQMRALLAGAGFSATVTTAPEPDDDNKAWSTVKVEPHEWERAMAFAATKLDLIDK